MRERHQHLVVKMSMKKKTESFSIRPLLRHNKQIVRSKRSVIQNSHIQAKKKATIMNILKIKKKENKKREWIKKHQVSRIGIMFVKVLSLNLLIDLKNSIL